MIEYKLFYLDRWNMFIEEHTMKGLKVDNELGLPLSNPIGNGYKVTTLDIEKLTADLVEHSNARQYFEVSLGELVCGIHLLEYLMTDIFASCVGTFFYASRITQKPGLKKDR